MSTELESLIRPFQNNDVTPSQTYYTAGQIGVPNIILRFGRNGKGKIMTGSYNDSASFYCKKYEIEQGKGGTGSDS